jgi:hypothetical protein
MVRRDQRSGELQTIRGPQGVRTQQTLGRSTSPSEVAPYE